MNVDEKGAMKEMFDASIFLFTQKDLKNCDGRDSYTIFLFVGDEPPIVNKIIPDTNDTIFKTAAMNRMAPDKVTRKSAITILANTTLYPFRYFRIFHCVYCTKPFLTISLLIEHMKEKYHSLTEAEVSSMLVFKSNDPMFVNVEEYGCKLCGDKTEDFEQLKKHLVEEHKKNIDVKNCGIIPYRIKGDNDFQCAHCEKKFDKYKPLRLHVKEHYKNFFCEQCGAGFITAPALKTHSMTHQTGESCCKTCGKVFKNEMTLKLHIKDVHAKAKRNICTVCSESFTSYYLKLKHLVDVHGVKIPEYRCKYCSKLFLLQAQCREHEKTHAKRL